MYNMVNGTFTYMNKEYKISDMVKAINRRYPELYHSESFNFFKDAVIDYTMSMDYNEQQSEMIHLMANAIWEDGEAKKKNDDAKRLEMATMFLVAVDLHPHYNVFLKNK